jgi:hypothetical protein
MLQKRFSPHGGQEGSRRRERDRKRERETERDVRDKISPRTSFLSDLLPARWWI